MTHKATPSSSLFASHNNTSTTPKDIRDKAEAAEVVNAPVVEEEVRGEVEEVGKKRQFHIVKGGKMDAFFFKKVILCTIYTVYILFIIYCCVVIYIYIMHVCRYMLYYYNYTSYYCIHIG